MISYNPASRTLWQNKFLPKSFIDYRKKRDGKFSAFFTLLTKALEKIIIKTRRKEQQPEKRHSYRFLPLVRTVRKGRIDMICPKCGYETSGNFCSHCGMPLNEGDSLFPRGEYGRADSGERADSFFENERTDWPNGSARASQAELENAPARYESRYKRTEKKENEKTDSVKKDSVKKDNDKKENIKTIVKKEIIKQEENKKKERTEKKNEKPEEKERESSLKARRKTHARKEGNYGQTGTVSTNNQTGTRRSDTQVGRRFGGERYGAPEDGQAGVRSYGSQGDAGTRRYGAPGDEQARAGRSGGSRRRSGDGRYGDSGERRSGDGLYGDSEDGLYGEPEVRRTGFRKYRTQEAHSEYEPHEYRGDESDGPGLGKAALKGAAGMLVLGSRIAQLFSCFLMAWMVWLMARSFMNHSNGLGDIRTLMTDRNIGLALYIGFAGLSLFMGVIWCLWILTKKAGGGQLRLKTYDTGRGFLPFLICTAVILLAAPAEALAAANALELGHAYLGVKAALQAVNAYRGSLLSCSILGFILSFVRKILRV